MKDEQNGKRSNRKQGEEEDEKSEKPSLGRYFTAFGTVGNASSSK